MCCHSSKQQKETNDSCGGDPGGITRGIRERISNVNQCEDNSFNSRRQEGLRQRGGGGVEIKLERRTSRRGGIEETGEAVKSGRRSPSGVRTGARPCAEGGANCVRRMRREGMSRGRGSAGGGRGDEWRE